MVQERAEAAFHVPPAGSRSPGTGHAPREARQVRAAAPAATQICGSASELRGAGLWGTALLPGRLSRAEGVTPGEAEPGGICQKDRRLASGASASKSVGRSYGLLQQHAAPAESPGPAQLQTYPSSDCRNGCTQVGGQQQGG